MPLRIALAPLALALLSSCVGCRDVTGGRDGDATMAPRDVAALGGPEWVVEDLAGRGIVDRSRVTLAFHDDGRVTGRASCNSYSGTYTRDGEGLTVGPVATTRMACPPALMEQELLFLEMLADVASGEVDAHGALVLRTADGRTITALRDP